MTQLETVNGGISCGQVYVVIAYLANNNPDQLASLSGMSIQCTEYSWTCDCTVISSVQMGIF